ncbi:MAG: class I SAM-dependent methyltransferase [Solirubrobacterales bacterium]
MCAVVREAEIFARPDWQMALGERAALEGIVGQLSPGLAIEIGTAEGRSLATIAANSTEVHAIDLTRELLADEPANAHFHQGDSRTVLPELLTGFAAEGRNVDFVLVDGDHSSDGARSDLETILASPAVARTVILVHDSFNPEVRSGIESARPAEHPKVIGFDPDFVQGRLGKLGPFANQMLGGFALVIVDEAAAAEGPRTVELGFYSLRPTPVLYHDSYESARRVARRVEGGTATKTAETSPGVRLDAAHLGREQLRRELEAVRSSWSWRITAPLRAVRARLRRQGPPPSTDA